MGWLNTAATVGITAIAVRYVPMLLKRRLPLHTTGTVKPGFEEVQQVFRRNFEKGLERDGSGSAFAVYYKGEKIVDLWGGYADPETNRKWKENTSTVVCSCTKTMAALCLARLADRGLVDFKQPVAKYWPEFAKKGKEQITVWQLITHQAGLEVLDEKPSYQKFSDPDILNKILSDTTPNWEPGTSRNYHAITYGLYVAKLVSLVDPRHRTVTQFFREEIAEPFDIDFHITLPLELSYRVARIRLLPQGVGTLINKIYRNPKFLKTVLAMLDSNSLLRKATDNYSELQSTWMAVYNDPDVRAIESPSGSGVGTARALAKIYGILSTGGALPGQDGKRLVSEDRIREMSTIATDGQDEMIKLDVKFGFGTWIFPYEDYNIFGHPGFGGQASFADPRYKLGYAYVTKDLSADGMGDDPRYLALRDALYRCVKRLEPSG